jgi:tetratricopeptide (TPR) repeat protein
LALKDIDEAVESFEHAVANDPFHSDAHNSLGVAYFNKHMIEEAIEAWQRAIILAPKSGRTYNNLAIAYHNIGDYERAWYYVGMAGRNRYTISEDFMNMLRRDSKKNK